MAESIDKQKESLESILNAVTAKEDIILSLEESKQRFQKNKQLPEFDELSFSEQKRLYKYLKKVGSPVYLACYSLISGICFTMGIVLVLWLTSIFLKQDILTSLLSGFKSFLQ